MHGLDQIKRMNDEAVARHEQKRHAAVQAEPIRRVVVQVEVVLRVVLPPSDDTTKITT